MRSDTEIREVFYTIVIVGLGTNTYSRAFCDVAQGMYEAIKRAGYDVTYSDTPFVGIRTPIVFGANLLESELLLPDHAIVVNLEQLMSTSHLLTPIYFKILTHHEVWDYSTANIDILRKMGADNVKYIDIGEFRQADFLIEAEQDIDVLFYGSMNQRRIDIIDALSATGITVVAVSNVFGPERDKLIARAKIVLNIHYYEAKLFESVRVTYLLQNRKCVVSESGNYDDEKEYAHVVCFCGYTELVQTCLDILQDEPKRARLEDAGRHFLEQKQRGKKFPLLLHERRICNSILHHFPRILSIGISHDRHPGVLHVGIGESSEPDIVFDPDCHVAAEGKLFKTTRFGSIYISDNSFDLIICADVFERCPDVCSPITTFLRLLRPGGILRVHVPYDLSYGAWRDPRHVRAFNETTWQNFVQWYPPVDSSTFRVCSITFQYSSLGDAMIKSGATYDETQRTPRAVNLMVIDLVKTSVPK
jgi:SAM-dependent methyltransferase